jgi:hypothetical protein
MTTDNTIIWSEPIRRRIEHHMTAGFSYGDALAMALREAAPERRADPIEQADYGRRTQQLWEKRRAG